MKFKLPQQEASNSFVKDFLDRTMKTRISSRELALAGLISQFMTQENIQASECELVEKTIWKNNGVETNWFVRKKTINYDI